MNRIQRVSSWLKEAGHTAAFIHTKENVFYLTGFYTEPHERLMGLFIFQEEEPFFVCPGMEAGQARNAGWNHEIIGYADHENPWELIEKALKKRNISIHMLAVEKDSISLSRAEQLKHATGGAQFVSAEETLNQFRLIKDDNEIRLLKEAAKLADYGVEVGTAALREGISEVEVLAQIEYELKKKEFRACLSLQWFYSEKNLASLMEILVQPR